MSWALLITLLELVGILSAAHAVMSVRTPQGTIAWAVSLIAAPFLAVPAYRRWEDSGRRRVQVIVTTEIEHHVRRVL
jgi:cardiolipin synthase